MCYKVNLFILKTILFFPFVPPSAGAILNLPYVQKHLALFIQEKENLQEALHAK